METSSSKFASAFIDQNYIFSNLSKTNDENVIAIWWQTNFQTLIVDCQNAKSVKFIQRQRVICELTLDFLPDWEEQNKVARGPKTRQKDSWRKAIRVKKAAKLKTSKLFLGFWHAHHSIFLYIGLSRTVSTYRWLDIRL